MLNKITRPKSRQPIPKNAKCVFRGILFDVYQWRQKMFDGSLRTFEKLKRDDTVQVIPITRQGKIILTYEEQPGKDKYIAIPGGHIDPGEKPLVAAKRELLEESGYQSDEWIFWFAVQPYAKIDWISYTFIARNCRKVGSPQLESGERIKLRLVNFEQYLQVMCSDDYRDAEIKARFIKTRFRPRELAKLKKVLLG